MFEVGDIVALKHRTESCGYISEISDKKIYPWNIKVVFFSTDYNQYNVFGAYTEENLVKVSNE